MITKIKQSSGSKIRVGSPVYIDSTGLIEYKREQARCIKCGKYCKLGSTIIDMHHSKCCNAYDKNILPKIIIGHVLESSSDYVLYKVSL